MKTAQDLIRAAGHLRDNVERLTFSPPVSHVYNPLVYAWEPHETYLRRWGAAPKEVLFLGMNPGPWGMAQIGVPFGEVALVRDWVGITGSVSKPRNPHPKRPVEGFACPRSEVSGRRLWGLFAARFTTAEAFFKGHFVTNYCPLMFMEEGGKNITPDKLPAGERAPLTAACDRHLQAVADALRPQWVIGIGAYAAARAAQALDGRGIRIASILHPSPASPAANRGWAAAATAELTRLGVW